MKYTIYDRKDNYDQVIESKLIHYLQANKIEHLNYASSYFVLTFQMDKMIGLGIRYINNFHPNSYYFYIDVLGSFQRRNVGSTILGLLEKNMPFIAPFQCLINAENRVANHFLLRHQFSLVRKTYDVEIEQAPVETSSRITRKLNELSLGELSEVKRLFYLNYLHYHKSVNPLNSKLDQNTFFKSIEKTIDLKRSEVLYDFVSNSLAEQKKIVSYILVGESTEQSIEVAYIGGEFESNIQYYLGFFCSVLNTLLTEYQILYLESDTTDFYMSSLVKHLNVNPLGQYNTYIKSFDEA
ncbi:hypothetical protein P256_00931 [Acinetobacter nectaris CIP 110549]|uniref:Uncharacterized protein n=1 Tax=Acinetobacter nectaris CIP 110549 TaxID=1392540 RepID=V2TCX0_9GAMM|nr:hypothetical protein [Acinetobacter nectaris]ESK40478.1 hypothetical protein P256_00931 [Acinetobacter nectaris CIP 110549]